MARPNFFEQNTEQRLASIQAQWNQLPEAIQYALEAIFSGLNDHSDQLTDAQKTALHRITEHYGNVLSKHLGEDERTKQQVAEEQKRRILLLEKTPLFQGLTPSGLLNLTERMERLTVESETDLMTEGQPADGVYFIQTGRVQILVNEELIAHRSDGDCFGEMSCLRGEPNASATVRTVTECEIFRIPRDRFMVAIRRAPQLWNNVFREMTSRFRDINQRLSEVLQHTPQGILKLDPEGRITNEYSLKCMDYLGMTHLRDQQFHRLLFPNAEAVQLGWEMSYPLLFSDVVSEEAVIAMLPKDVVFLHPNGQERFYSLSYYLCRDSEGQIVAVDIGLEDHTQAHELAKKSEALEAERSILKKLYDDPEGYLNLLDLLASTLELLHQIQTDFMEEPLADHTEGFQRLEQRLYTVNQLGQVYTIHELTPLTTQVLQTLATLEDAPILLTHKLRQLQETIDDFSAQWERLRLLFDALSDELRRRLRGVAFTRDSFSELKQLAENRFAADVDMALLHLDKVPARKLFRHWPQLAEKQSQRFGKQVKLHIEDVDLTISYYLFQQLKWALDPMLQNCLEHGLERPEQRKEKQKSNWGMIRVKFYQQEQVFVLELADDGVGLNADQILERARSLPKMKPEHIEKYLANNQPFHLLLLPGFSSSDTHEGKGLNELRDVLITLHGTLDIQSEWGQGTTFTLQIPMDQE